MEEVPNQEQVQLHQSEPFNLRHHEAKVKTKAEKPKRKISLSVILLSLFILIVTILAIGALFYANQQKKAQAISDFESCAAAGNPIMESYPEQCSANGKTFTRVLTEEEQKKLSSNLSSENKIYQGDGYTFEYPSDWALTQDNTLTKSVKYEGEPVYGDVTPGWAEIQIGSVENLSKEKNFQNSEFLELSQDTEEVNINGYKALKATGDTGIGVYYHAYFIEKDPNSSVQITMITQDQKLQEAFIKDFDQILSTFKFTDQNSAIDTSSWKTYNYQNLSLKYPASWKVTFNSKVANQPYGFDLSVNPNQDQIGGTGLSLTTFDANFGGYELNENKEFTENTDLISTISFSMDNVKIFARCDYLTGEGKDIKFDQDKLDICNQILSTLKFTQ